METFVLFLCCCWVIAVTTGMKSIFFYLDNKITIHLSSQDLVDHHTKVEDDKSEIDPKGSYENI